MQSHVIRDCNPGIPTVFIKSQITGFESWDWVRQNPGISGLQKLAKIVLIHVINDRNMNFLPFITWTSGEQNIL